MRRIYGARRDVLLEGLRRQLGRWLEPVPSAAGLHLTALAKGSVDIAALVECARQHEVSVVPIDRYRIGRARNSGLVFGYGTLESDGIVTGLARLRNVLAQLAP